MGNDHSTLPLDRFHDMERASRFQCRDCENVPFYPIATECCTSVYCRTWLEVKAAENGGICPYCGAKFGRYGKGTAGGLINNDMCKLIWDEFNSLKIRCSTNSGCPAVVRLDEICAHEENCTHPKGFFGWYDAKNAHTHTYGIQAKEENENGAVNGNGKMTGENRTDIGKSRFGAYGANGLLRGYSYNGDEKGGTNGNSKYINGNGTNGDINGTGHVGRKVCPLYNRSVSVNGLNGKHGNGEKFEMGGFKGMADTDGPVEGE